MEETLQHIQKQALDELERAQNLSAFVALEQTYFGRKGKINEQMKVLPTLPPEKRPEFGKHVNALRKTLEELFAEKRHALEQQEIEKSLTEEWVDITAPGKRYDIGHIHPISQVQRDVEHIFSDMGFMIGDGPEVESEFYNFEQLNIPAWHPARDIQDTFFLEQAFATDGGRSVLRTHTSPGQIRTMERYGAPLRVIIPGRCFRYEATDASHDATFYQVEGLMVDRAISLAHLKGVMVEFLTRFFRREIRVRFRPSYFPFVEPGIELDISCALCGAMGCRVCSWSSWIEFMGAGMVHPNVLKAGGIDPKKFQGWAFGFGLTRLTMMRYGIDDIRLLSNGDLRFLQQF